MKQISIFGVGYVGMVQAVCFAKAGFEVFLYDKNPIKNKNVQDKKTTIIEPGVQQYLEKYFSKIKVVDGINSALKNSEVSFVCVGTPPKDDGTVDVAALFGFAKEAGEALKTKKDHHLFVIRSTVPPGTTKNIIEEIEKFSGKKYGKEFGAIMQPEFLREGSGVEDFFSPSFTIIGAENDRDFEFLKDIYKKAGIKENVFKFSFVEAEIFKYLNNAYHALKIDFSNEVAQIGDKLRIDPHKMMKIFVLDKKLNVSPYYLFPGMPFGGYCLPKDAKGLEHIVRSQNMNTPLLNSILKSNENHFEFIFQSLISKLPQTGKVGLLGVAFKKGVDDIRESPYIRIFQSLNSRGYRANFYDPEVNKDRILGANLSYVQSLFINFFDYQMVKIEDFVEKNDTILIGVGNGLEDLLKVKDKLKDKKTICLNPSLYDRLEKEKITFEKIF